MMKQLRMRPRTVSAFRHSVARRNTSPGAVARRLRQRASRLRLQTKEFPAFPPPPPSGALGLRASGGFEAPSIIPQRLVSGREEPR